MILSDIFPFKQLSVWILMFYKVGACLFNFLESKDLCFKILYLHGLTEDLACVLIFHSAYSLETHYKHWISEPWTKARMGHTGLGSSKSLFTFS